MKLSWRQLEEWKIVTPEGIRLDAPIADAFKQAIGDVIASGAKKLIVNLSKVEFMDSSGLGALIACRQKLGESGQLVLASAQGDVATLLRLTHLDRVFCLVNAPEDVMQKTT